MISSNPDPAQLYLASKSPRRQELLGQLGLRYRVLDPLLDESVFVEPTVSRLASRLAVAKVDAGFDIICRDEQPALPVLAADTLVVQAGNCFGKPSDFQEFSAMFRQLSGQWHEVITALALRDDQRTIHRVSSNAVRFRIIDETEIKHYWESGEPIDKAGGYAIQGLGACFVVEIRGSFSAIMGLPLFELAGLLPEFGINVL